MKKTISTGWKSASYEVDMTFSYLFFTVQVPIFTGDNGVRADVFDVHVHLWKKENTLMLRNSFCNDIDQE